MAARETTRRVRRAGGWLAIVLSSLWALPGVALVVVGVVVLLSGKGDNRAVDMEGFAQFVGGSLAVAGAAVVGAAGGGLLLCFRPLRGRRGRVGSVLLFGVFALVSGSFLVSAFADEFGV